MLVRETKAMVAGMAPELIEGRFVFCTSSDPALVARAMPDAIATFVEREGHSFILPFDAAGALGCDCSQPMREIRLNVNSALDGVGLTAAVAQELAGNGIACNIVAAFHHDHVFVPEQTAARALALLAALSRNQAEARGA